jgi:hypothetical protein
MLRTTIFTLTRLLVIGVNLILWGQADSGVCIVAASIPHLRFLLRDASGKYFKSSNYGGETRLGTLSNGPWSRTTTSITGGGRALQSGVHAFTKKPDGRSERRILNNESSPSVTQDGIMQSTEIAVEYHYGNDLDGHEEFVFELRKVGGS